MCSYFLLFPKDMRMGNDGVNSGDEEEKISLSRFFPCLLHSGTNLGHGTQQGIQENHHTCAVIEVQFPSF